MASDCGGVQRQSSRPEIQRSTTAMLTRYVRRSGTSDLHRPPSALDL